MLCSSWLWHNPFFFCIFFHQISDIISTFNSIFEHWGKVGKVCFQMFRNFEVAMNVTKQSSTPNLLHESFFAERALIGEICSKMIFYSCISSVFFPPLALPHFNNFVYFLLDIFFAHLILFPLFYLSHNFVVSQGRAKLLAWTVVVITTHCFKDSVKMVTTSINTKAINLLLSTSRNIAFNFTIRTSMLNLRRNHIFKRACFVLSRRELLRFGVIVPSCIQSSRHWLTHRLGIELTCVYADIWFAHIRLFAEKSFVNHSFACKDNGRTTNHIFTNLLQQVLVVFSKRVKFWICWFLQANVCQIR